MKKPPRSNAAPGPFDKVRRTRLFPKTLESALYFPAAESLRKRGFGERNIVRDWAQIIGQELAQHTAPLKLARQGQQGPMALHIQASGAYALLVQHSEPRILEQLSLYYGRSMAQKIVILQ
ncbi:MAG: DUF721 domain-containing protein [Rickettsiales bacterium]|nr:DUF721 domain-containing protein [Rickettsiales bacterium]